MIVSLSYFQWSVCDNSCYNSSKHYYLEWFCGPLTWVMFNAANDQYICVRKLFFRKDSFFLFTFLVNQLWHMEWTFTVSSFSLWLWVDSEVHNSKKDFLWNLFSVHHRNGVKDGCQPRCVTLLSSPVSAHYSYRKNRLSEWQVDSVFPK